ncbi:MAG: Cna B-type protein, partial [Bryobacterales bacterium]|nr:Cna B-type protein [Bryobacterales bacterium]
MSKVPRLSIPVFIIFLAACLSSLLHAQQITGSITGSVLDPSGAGIPGIPVRLTNTGTGSTAVATVDTSSNFQFLLLPPGTYLIEVSNPGFKTFRRDGIVVTADRSIAIPVTLTVGATSETVEVVASTPLLDPNSSEVGTTIDSQKMVDLPLNSRNPMGLANLIPTVKGIGYFGGQVLTSWRVGAVTIGGGQPMTSAFLMDGVANDKMGDAAGPSTFLTTDSTQEFKVITNSASAEYGRTTGGVISVVSKSGSNNLHGSAFEYLQNTMFNANDFFSNASGTPLPPVHQNQFGGSLGGRIKKDRTFFFGNFEGLIQHLSSARIINAPTALQRTGDFSKTFAANGQLITIYDPYTTVPNPNSAGAFIRSAFPGNVIPGSRISQFAKAFFALHPLPNLPGAPVTGANNLFQSGPVPTDRQTGGVKVDHTLTSNQRVSIRYTRDVLNETVPNGAYFQNVLENDKKTIYVPRHSASASYTATLSPTLIVDARSGFNRDYDQATPYSYDGKYAKTGYPLTELGFPKSLVDQMQTGTAQFPGLTVTDLSSYGSAIQNRAAYTWGSGASVTKVLTSHTVKAGYQFTLYRGFPFDRSPLNFAFTRAFTQGPNPTTASTTSGFGTASLILGTPATGNAVYQPVHEQQELDHALYVQDDWKFNRKLTFNLGLRWERQGAFTDRFNQMTNFDPDARYAINGMNFKGGTVFPGVGGVPRGVVAEPNKHFAPRIGFAYQWNSKVVVRGGYGIFWVREKGVLNPASTGYGSTTPMVTSLDNGLHPANTIDNPWPSGIVLPTGSAGGLATGIGTSIGGQLRNVYQGYAQQWNMTVQYQP